MQLVAAIDGVFATKTSLSLLTRGADLSARRSGFQHDPDRTTQALGEVIGELMAEARHHI
jgi:hypothetical protein